MKNKLKDWNLFEIIFLTLSIAIIIAVFIFNSQKNWLSLTGSIIGIIGVMLFAKGFSFAPYFFAGNAVLYSILSYTQAYYGQTIIYVIFMIPMSIISIISWSKNKNKENTAHVVVNKTKKSEYVYIAIASICIGIGFYFLLKLFNTDQLIINTISFVITAIAVYLSFRRNSNYAIFYIINDLFLIILWSISISKSGMGYIPTVICFVIFLINDIYGLIRWKIEEKKQLQQNDEKKPNN